MRLPLVVIIGLCLTTLMALAGDDVEQERQSSPSHLCRNPGMPSFSKHGFARF